MWAESQGNSGACDVGEGVGPLVRVTPMLGLVHGIFRGGTAVMKMAPEVPSRELRSIGKLQLHAAILFRMSTLIFGVIFLPLDFHSPF